MEWMKFEKKEKIRKEGVLFCKIEFEFCLDQKLKETIVEKYK